MQLQLITDLLKVFIENIYGLNFLHFIDGDITEIVISDVNTLYCNRKKNLLYIFFKILSKEKLKLAKCPLDLGDAPGSNHILSWSAVIMVAGRMFSHSLVFNAVLA